MPRIAIESEYEAIAGLWVRANDARTGGTFRGNPTDGAALLRARAECPGAWVGVQEHDGSIVAIASGLQARGFDGSGDLIPALMHISMIAVEPALWGHGFGRSMIEFALATARGCAYEAAQLWTSRSNDRARGLYEKLGFRTTGREKRDERGEEIVQYRLEL